MSVAYATKEQTATAEADYVPASGTLTFEPGETSKEVVITIIDDDAFEKVWYLLYFLTLPPHRQLLKKDGVPFPEGEEEKPLREFVGGDVSGKINLHLTIVDD